MSRLKDFLRIGALAGLMTFFPSCEKEPQGGDAGYKLPDFKNVSEKVLKSELEFPSGLANHTDFQKKGLKSSNDIKAEVDGVYIEGPLFINTGPGGSLVPYIGPKISEYSATSTSSLENLTTSSLAEIDAEIYLSDFDSQYYYALPDSLWRATSLSLDELVLGDNSVLTSSNSSDKIFRTNSSGETEVYLQNPELERITDMIQGSDGKVYAVKAPLIDENSSSLVLSPKKVISIENNLINTEFELPSDVNSHSWDFNYWINNWWKDAPLWEKLKIIENSENGKKQFGAEFYVSDLLEGKIYKVGSDKKVEILAQELRFPSSLAVDSTGNIFYTTSPMFRGYNLAYPTQMFSLNPETGESKLVHTFDENIEDYLNTGSAIEMRYDKSVYVLPRGFNVSNVLYESQDKLEFLVTNSNQGDLKLVSLEK